MLSSVNGSSNQGHYISADYLSPMPATVSCQSPESAGSNLLRALA